MLKLILADNQAIFRAGIAKVLAVEDEMRIVAQAQTAEQMFMALDKFRAAVLIIAGGFHSDFNSVLTAANKNKTRVVVLADTGESAQRYMAAGAHGVVYRNVTSPALVDCVRKIARGESWVQDMAVPSELTENDMVGLRSRCPANAFLEAGRFYDGAKAFGDAQDRFALPHSTTYARQDPLALPSPPAIVPAGV